MLGAMKIPWPTRRWLQFSLCALLVFVALSAIPCRWLAVKLRQMKREEAAAKAFKELAATVEWDENSPGPAWLRGLLGEHFFTHVRRVYLRVWVVTDGMLEHLDAMDHLQELDLDVLRGTDAILGHLQGFRELKTLRLHRAGVTDVGLEKTAELKQLDTLVLDDVQVTNAGLGKLAGLNNLKTLYLSAGNVTDAGLEQLERTTQLTCIRLVYLHVTAAGVKKLQQALPNCHVYAEPGRSGIMPMP